MHSAKRKNLRSKPPRDESRRVCWIVDERGNRWPLIERAYLIVSGEEDRRCRLDGHVVIDLDRREISFDGCWQAVGSAIQTLISLST